MQNSNIKELSWRLFGENFVFRDGDYYYKMPTFLAKKTIYRKTDSYQKVLESMNMIKNFFGPIVKIPETDIKKDENGDYMIKQKSITGEKISKKLLEENPKLLSKFKRLIIANEIMRVQKGAFLDLLGSDIVKNPNLIHNLITDGENIYIFDFGLLENSNNNILFRYISHFIKNIQLKFLNLFF